MPRTNVVQSGRPPRIRRSSPQSAKAPEGDWSADEIRSLQTSLKAWSKRTPRDMPWRGVGDPYRVWISEIMLQQTTVAAVVPYYERFLARFPDIATLANAHEQDVLSAWEGLGYYSRGRNLHRAAQAVMSNHGGEFPRDVEALRGLPGVGRYTAGAIASFAFDVKAPILEANTQRVYARLAGDEGDPRTSDGQTRLWNFAERILPARGAGPFNQALIDLGALVCVPGRPKCEECPLVHLCRAHRAGRQDQIPPAKARPKVTDVHEAVMAVRRNGTWLVRQRQPGERWAGMWDFPRLPLERPIETPGKAFAGLQDALMDSTGLHALPAALLPHFSHSVTRYRIHLARVVANYAAGEWSQLAEVRWLKLEELAALPMPMAARRLVRDLDQPGWAPDAPFELSSTSGRRRNAKPR
ncbi:A/G-specific adenine glycosylase [Caulifigura coniformis]|uniref:Adenine DNA glycosylase n=1 Tax=Caulifigura coniformis TaxID=2527983 RepID=A0A517SG00_9PLAN|nr:A/G-specific adenine glycosylase [Caulifigura coniformis]QDT55065.1 A/G-specific adenine glycosylase [Caulifigura coniformis]